MRYRWSVAFSLVVAIIVRAQCPPPTTPTKPAAGLVTTETHIAFEWNPGGDAVTGYDTYLSTNGGAFTRICFNTPSPNCSAVLGTGRYEWFVRNFRDDCLGGTESPHAQFEIVACSAPVAPASLAPSGTSDVSPAGATLTWSGGAADFYEVFLEQGSACSTTTPIARTAGSSLDTGALARGATYSWRVRANRGSTCPPPVFSACATFRTRSCDPPAAFGLAAPDSGAVTPATARLQWSAASGAASYNVYTRTNAAQPFALAGATAATSMYAAFAPSTTVEWYVEAIAGTCATASAHRFFTTAACDVAAPVLIAPAAAIAPGTPVTLRWSAARNAERYRVWLARSGAPFAPVEETTDTTAIAHRPAGSYDWYVEAIGGACPAALSPTGHFVVPPSQACSGAPALLSPANGAAVRGDAAFSWSAVANAAQYELWASVNHGAPQRLTTRSTTAFQTNLAPGSVEWYVVAHADGCDDVQSAAGAFTSQETANCANRVPLLLAPAIGAVNVPQSVDLFWTNVPGVSAYRVWAAAGEDAPAVIATTPDIRSRVTLPAGRIRWFVEAVFPDGCGSARTAEEWFRTAPSGGCVLPAAPAVDAPPGAPAGTNYELHWTPLPHIDHYEILRTSDAGSQPVLLTTRDVVLAERSDVTSATRFRYRVRGVSDCDAGTGPFSAEAVVLVSPASSPSSSVATTIPYGTAEAIRTIFIPGAGAGVRFTATADRPWVVIDPSSGVLPPEGITLTIRLLANQLETGDHAASIRIDTAVAGKSGTNGSATTPVSVTVVTPVTPSTGTPPAPASLILPAVAHAGGGGAEFRSDARLLNSGPRPLRYSLTFVPSGPDGLKLAQTASVQVSGGSAIALNDLLSAFFGAGGTSLAGSLEIRPVVSSGDSVTGDVSFASSRTYAMTPAGTAGQFIPAIPLSKFGLQNAVQLLAQVSQQGAFRTNIGLVEGSGQPASGLLQFFAANGALLGTQPFSLKPREHAQLNSLITSDNALSSAARVELTANGRVTAYASILDQATNDPMLISSAPLASSGPSRYVVPGVASLSATNGQWRSDLRVYNGSAIAQPVTLSFMPRGAAGAAQQVSVTLNANESRPFDDVLRTMFGQSSASGSVLVTAADPSQLAVTARTYFDNGAGTYGQYIPALTANDGARLGGRARELLQVEQSGDYRTNVGLVEISGAPATVEITASLPEVKASPVIDVTLAANEFRQLDSILSSLGFENVHNARLSIRVIDGAGVVGAYASLIDNRTGDPTLIPAQ